MKSKNHSPALSLFICAAALALPSSLQAATLTLDWNLVTWAPGQLSQSFDIDPSNPGNDVTITVSGNTNRISSSIIADTVITGGVSPTNKTLKLITDFSSNLESIVVKIDFNYFDGVSGVNYLLHDIDGDGSTWREEVRGIFATNGGPNFAPTDITTLNATPTFQIAGAGLNRLLTGNVIADDAASTGSASVSFGSQLTHSTSFRFGASTVGSFDPIDSGISLGAITFSNTPVPEPSSVMLVLSAVTLTHLARRREKAGR